MPRLTTIATHTGDDGTTGLGGGQRVPKDHRRVQAYGAVDELNSVIGAALAHGLAPRLAQVLPEIQNDLFHLGSDLCFVEADQASRRVPQIEARHVERLDGLIVELNAVVGRLQNFVLPGGSMGAALLHVARAVCRRAERDAIALAHVEPVGAFVIPYLNRLSDVLFVMARVENKTRGVREPLWDPAA